MQDREFEVRLTGNLRKELDNPSLSVPTTWDGISWRHPVTKAIYKYQGKSVKQVLSVNPILIPNYGSRR